MEEHNKSKVIVDKAGVDFLKVKYTSVSPREFDEFIKRFISYYSKMDQATLEKMGFSNGQKQEFFDRIKEMITFIQEDYVPPAPRIILQKEETTEEVEEPSGLSTNRINWLTEEFWDSWDKVKGHTKKMLGNDYPFLDFETYRENQNWFFMAHDKDEIIGRPQLIDNVQKRIPLIKTVLKTIKEKDQEGKNENKTYIKYYFFDDKYDKRYDGNHIDSFALDFWMYRVITPEGKEVFMWTDKKLPNQQCTFKGMLVEMDDIAELSNSMKVKSISKIFFLKEFEPSVKILPKEELIELTKEKNINEEQWLNFLALHPFGTMNKFPLEMEELKSAQLLSSKVDGYPLHIFFWGPTGTRKSMGIIETTAFKFSEDSQIVEGANSRIKGLIPSFKEKPANLGYLAKQDRMGWVDEIGKMVEGEMNKHQEKVTNVLGELNFLLDHKKRLVGSGNDNECEVEATAKFTFVSNPVNGKQTIYEHIGLIDPTTMSRMLHWVQDESEQSFVLGSKGIIRFPPTLSQALDMEKIKRDICLCMCWGELSELFSIICPLSRNEFLTIFDTCNSFLSLIDLEKVKFLYDEVTSKAKEPLRTSVWKPRGMHHVTLLVDGICKKRCLFKDYDSTFEAKQEDYELAQKILQRMVKSWDTDISIKKAFFEA